MVINSLDKDPIALFLGVLIVVFIFFGFNNLVEQKDCVTGKTYLQDNISITFNENGTYTSYYAVSTDTIKYWGNWRTFDNKVFTSISWSTNGKGIFKVNTYENTCDKLYNDDISFTLDKN